MSTFFTIIKWFLSISFFGWWALSLFFTGAALSSQYVENVRTVLIFLFFLLLTPAIFGSLYYYTEGEFLLVPRKIILIVFAGVSVLLSLYAGGLFLMGKLVHTTPSILNGSYEKKIGKWAYFGNLR